MLSEIQKVILTCLLGPEDKGAWSREKAFWYYRNNTQERLEYAKTRRETFPEKAREADDRSKLKNRESRLLHSRSRRQGRLDKLNLLKIGRPCHDCGNCFPPYCMDWDHLDPLNKSFDIADCPNKRLEDVLVEIQKCQLVCANCHRVRTQTQKQRIKRESFMNLVDTKEI